MLKTFLLFILSISSVGCFYFELQASASFTMKKEKWIIWRWEINNEMAFFLDDDDGVAINKIGNWCKKWIFWRNTKLDEWSSLCFSSHSNSTAGASNYFQTIQLQVEMKTKENHVEMKICLMISDTKSLERIQKFKRKFAHISSLHKSTCIERLETFLRFGHFTTFKWLSFSFYFKIQTKLKVDEILFQIWAQKDFVDCQLDAKNEWKFRKYSAFVLIFKVCFLLK